ncbi:MAG: glycine--tRNA ligase [Candidatus Thermoplasmatota archaeon]|nr:glycine--tRNA ligase [Candidatus Thermoplasmatota archaeon]
MDKYAEILAMAKRRGFLYPSFEIYGGVAGFYDYGPMGAALKRKIEDQWRKFYVLGEGFGEIMCPAVTPEEVFIASGHVKEFTDFVVECKKCQTAFRADHLIEETGLKIHQHNKETMDKMIAEAKIKCPQCGGEFAEAHPVNLMFNTKIGVGKNKNAYLRPETAQGMFLNFSSLYRHFRERLPFGAVQLGRGYRNEISPRQGLIRQREFWMAEAEIFFDPENKKHPRFAQMKDVKATLVPNTTREPVEMTLGDALSKGIVKNEALAYYIALTSKLFTTIGIDPARLRFRQHEHDEMAHYANDCWDAEAFLDKLGWVEITGIADRSAYDLSSHMKASGVDLSAMRKYDAPRTVERIAVKPKMKELGQKFKKDAGDVKKALESVDACAIGPEGIELEINGNKIFVEKELYEAAKVQETVYGERFIPHVIEPSYGIDRIFYTVMDHAFSRTKNEEGEEYTTLRLAPVVAPIKVGIFPLMCKDGLDKIAEEIEAKLRTAGIECQYDDSGSIGRRYARMDEIGTPWCITVDFDTLKDNTVTVRDRDTKEQKRVKIEALAPMFREKLGL